MEYTEVKTLADLEAVKAAALTQYYIPARIGSCKLTASHHSRNGKSCVTFKVNGRRSSFAELAEIITYL